MKEAHKTLGKKCESVTKLREKKKKNHFQWKYRTISEWNAGLEECFFLWDILEKISPNVTKKMFYGTWNVAEDMVWVESLQVSFMRGS